MATKRQVEARCKALGVTFDYDPECGNIGITAPEGFHFAADVYGFHYADFPVGRNSGWRRQDIYAACLETMSDGIEECDAMCECYDTGD